MESRTRSPRRLGLEGPLLASHRHPDWDGVFTLGLTALVFVLSLGAAYGIWFHRVLKVARKTAETADREPPTCWVIPGKRLLADRPDADFRARLERAAQLAKEQSVGRIVILGGQTAMATVTEAEAGGRYLARIADLDPGRIEFESLSGNTLTNLRNLRDLLRSRVSSPLRIVIISNRYHLARLALIADSLAMAHGLEPAEPELWLNAAGLRQIARESFYCLWFVVGKTWARATGNRRMLARVT